MNKYNKSYDFTRPFSKSRTSKQSLENLEQSLISKSPSSYAKKSILNVKNLSQTVSRSQNKIQYLDRKTEHSRKMSRNTSRKLIQLERAQIERQRAKQNYKERQYLSTIQMKRVKQEVKNKKLQEYYQTKGSRQSMKSFKNSLYLQEKNSQAIDKETIKKRNNQTYVKNKSMHDHVRNIQREQSFRMKRFLQNKRYRIQQNLVQDIEKNVRMENILKSRLRSLSSLEKKINQTRIQSELSYNSRYCKLQELNGLKKTYLSKSSLQEDQP